MNNFGYARAASIEDAIAQAQSRPSQYIAGGTELLNWIRLGIAAPDQLVDLGASGASRDIKLSGNELVIGALATLNDVGEHELTHGPCGRVGRSVPESSLGSGTQSCDARRQCLAENALRLLSLRVAAAVGL